MLKRLMIPVNSAGIQDAAVKDVARNEDRRVNTGLFSRHPSPGSHHFLDFVENFQSRLAMAALIS
jgi:hypothetical protein